MPASVVPGHRLLMPLLMLIAVFTWAAPCVFAAEPKPKKPDASNAFFDEGAIPLLRISISKEDEQKLRSEPRKFVSCTMSEDDKTNYANMRVKLKGAAGSFRNYDDRPALTIRMGKKNERFHGLDKFHLNNSVQDDSYVSELMSAHIIRAAGYPATRVTHARVYINGRDLGFYVLKEGFDEHFLDRNFKSDKGNLYDGGFCQDIDANLELDEGDEATQREDLKALIAACREPDAAKRWPAIEARLDVDMFLRFTALELMMCHWDGYVQNRNNYRVYFRGDDGKAVFLLHGMDQMFGDTNFSVFHVPGPIVANAVLQNPAWRQRYRDIVREILPHFAPDKLHAQIDAAHKRMRPVVAAMGEDRAKHLDSRVQDFKNRLVNRQKAILSQFPPEPVRFNNEGWVLIEGWEAKPQGDARLAVEKDAAGKPMLLIATGASKQCHASFRATVRLGKGSYRIEAKVKPTDIAPLDGGAGQGAGVRISGGSRENKVIGSGDWQTVTQAFDVTDELREVVLVAELRSSAGSALFDPATMRVVKVK